MARQRAEPGLRRRPAARTPRCRATSTAAPTAGGSPSRSWRAGTTRAAYGSFLTVAALLVLVPDVAVVLRSTLTAGRRRGALTTPGVVTCSALQGADAAGDLGAVVVRSQPVFEAICWAGTAYWVHLGAQAVRSAVAGRYGAPDPRMTTQPAQRLVGWRAGLPVRGHRPRRSCLPPDGAAAVPRGRRRRPGAAAVRAPHAALGLVYLLSLVATVHRTRHLVGRHPVRRALDAPTGVALLGFGVRRATEHG